MRGKRTSKRGGDEALWLKNVSISNASMGALCINLTTKSKQLSRKGHLEKMWFCQ